MKEYHTSIPLNNRKTICINFESEENYQDCMNNKGKFKLHITKTHEKYPELFPKGLSLGWILHGYTSSIKTGYEMHRIKLKTTKEVYQVRPSFLMPFMIGKTEEVSKGLNIYHSGSSFEAVSNNFGKDAMYWYRAFCSIGRNSIVGTTVKNMEKFPKHLAADEKHTKWFNERVYLATTVAKGCFLGSALSEDASEEGLKKAYGKFMEEAQELKPDYQPESVNTDGWKATKKAWKNLSGQIILVLCFLHSVLKIQNVTRNYPKKKELMDKVWDSYNSVSIASFSQQLRRLNEWADKENLPDKISEKVKELCQKKEQFKPGLEIEGAHRTSNMADRLMDYQDRVLYRARYLHSLELSGTANLFVRAIALVWNFHPYCKKVKRHSPFEDLNGFIYHQNWLENMMIATSLGGRR